MMRPRRLSRMPGNSVRRDAGACTALAARCSARHPAAFFGAATACLRAFLAMGHLMLSAFVAAGFAHLRAGLADGSRHFAAARHVAGSEAADCRAIDVERNAARHRFRVGFLQAGYRAVVARERTGIAGIDAGLVLFVSHVSSGFGFEKAHSFGPCAVPQFLASRTDLIQVNQLSGLRF